MKILFLNLWDCELKDSIEKYIKKHAQDTDIFCFQEAYEKAPNLLKNWLPDFEEIIEYKGEQFHNWFTQTTYVKNTVNVISKETLFLNNTDIGLGINIKVQTPAQKINVCNMHGVAWPGEDKKDTPERILQSQELINFFKDTTDPVIIGGDFNLDLNTKSLQMFEEQGYRNLIKDFNVKSTRNRIVWELYPNSKQYYADYVLVSPTIEIESFVVEDDEVSDHQPLLLKIK